MSNKKLGWKAVLGVLLIIAAWVAAYNLDRPAEKNVLAPLVTEYRA